MADINLTCPSCGKTRVVSEFTDRSQLKCKHCGAAFGPASPDEEAARAAETARPGLKVALRRTQSNAGTPASAGTAPVEARPMPVPQKDGPTNLRDRAVRPELRKERRPISHAWIAAAIFVLFGGAMWYLRYRAALPARYLNFSVEYAWLVVIGIHVAIVLRAMAESIFQGILCLLIPGYSLYYLFAVTDAFYMRAIVAGVLVGIGQDAVLRMNEHAIHVTSLVHSWIAHGGGDIR